MIINARIIRAARLYNRKRYRQALRLLEPEIINYQDNEHYFLLIGLCCIHNRNISEAVTYLQCGHRINEQNIDILQTLAVCSYLQKASADSISYLLTILDEYPKNKRAAAFLQHIRLRIEKDKRSRRGAEKSLVGIVPFLPTIFSYLKWRRVLIVCIGTILITSVILIGIRIGISARESITNTNNDTYEMVPGEPVPDTTITKPAARIGVEEIVTARQAEPRIDYAAPSNNYVLNDAQVNELLNKIENDFLSGNDNSACISINRILRSNAHSQIKQRMIFFSSYLIQPDFTTPFTEYSYQEVLAESALYNSCYVKWRGAIANIIVRDDQVSEFDFLVGYESGEVLEGIVPSFSDIKYDFRISDAYEVIAQVRSQDANEKLELYITDLRPLRNQQE